MTHNRTHPRALHLATLSLCAFFILHSTFFISRAAALLPLPASITLPDPAAAQTVLLTPRHIIICPDANLATQASDIIHQWTTLRLPIRPAKDDSTSPTITITLLGNAGVPPADEGRPDPRPAESYTLTIDPTANITITAPTPAGAFYALQTLAQLLAASESTPARQRPLARQRPIENRESKIENPPLPILTIHDTPRFAWRGLHLDEARHFFGSASVKRLLDIMALFKFNTLHWHLTDDQGWRIEIKKYPKLTQTGAWRAASPIQGDRYTPDATPYGGYYTQDQIREIVAYARQRHITIVPEIEIPGHSSAALAAYPQHGNTDIPDYAPKVQTTWAIHPYTYAPKEETLAFLSDILDEVCDLFPGKYIHIGGDEAPKTQWNASPQARQVMRQNHLANADELQAWFLRRVEQHLAARGRSIIGWDEIQEGGLSPTAVMMVWRDWKYALHALEKGNQIILTPRLYCYLDYTTGDLPDADPYYDNISRYQNPPRVVTLEKAYTLDPLAEGVRPDQEPQILGCQANLWTEYIYDWPKAEYFLFPRALAIAESAWTPRSARSYPDFLRRLPAALRLLDNLNVNYKPEK